MVYPYKLNYNTIVIIIMIIITNFVIIVLEGNIYRYTIQKCLTKRKIINLKLLVRIDDSH